MAFDLAGSYGTDDTTEEFDADTMEEKGGSWSWMDLDDLPQNVQNAYKIGDHIMDEMMKAIHVYPNGTSLQVEYENGKTILEGRIDTVFESCNCLEEEDPNYKEYYACAFRIDRILRNAGNNMYTVGRLIEISIDYEPTRILHDGSVIWEKT